VFDDPAGPFNEGLRARSVERGSTEDPRTFGERMQRLDLGALGGKAQRLGADAEVSGSLGQIEPRLDPVFGRTVRRDLVVRRQRGHAFARPAVAVARRQLVPVQQAGDQIIIRNKDQLPDGVNDVGRGTVALATASARQTQFRIDAAHPSWITVRTMRFLSRASVVEADQTALRSSARAASDGGDLSGPDVLAASCSAILASIFIFQTDEIEKYFLRAA